ncbi:hypothetical protein GOBAR_AA04078 [Gossypium barbadense]|uniref:PSII 6.1 kDa protein n=1 Tax=Gossypium barbadense TaxID=3634 RepID=A0A2P5YLL5_GOSBA|nr:hypothetical protein GOBAR_AA04078 [Gossypium barbadense]
MGMSASLLAAVCATTISSPAMGLMDDRMSTKETGLLFGMSSNLLRWILLGLFSLIWTLYIVYTSFIDEDEGSKLSL